MFHNYLLTAIRNILRHKSFSLLNIVGLALSMSVCLLIIMIIQDQMSYDEQHTLGDRIYRVLTVNELSEARLTRFATTAYPMSAYLEENFPVVENSAVIRRAWHADGRANHKVLRVEMLYVDRGFFEMFDFPLRGTSPEAALADPGTVILTAEAARKFYGEENPLGKVFIVDSIGEFIVGGTVPETGLKSHIQFDVLVSVEHMDNPPLDNWGHIYNSYAYVLLKQGVKPAELDPAFAKIRQERYVDDPEKDFSFQLQSLGNICPGPMLANELGFYIPRAVIWFMGGLAVVLILTSAFNYTNLSLAKSLARAREIGIRKVSGARRMQVFGQFLIESVLLALFALVLAWLMLQFIAPAFEGMTFMSMLKISLNENLALYGWFLLFSIFAGLLAGLLPASYLSAFQPIAVFKDTHGVRVMTRQFLRKALLVAQFSVSIILFISILLGYRQLNFFMNADYGFNKENTLNVNLQGNDPALAKAAFEPVPEVRALSGAGHIPGVGNRRSEKAWLESEEDEFDLAYFWVDPQYIGLMGLSLLAGEDFPEAPQTGGEKYLILNETAVQKFGFEQNGEALGQVITMEDSLLLEVIGVVKDYHFFVMFTQIGPMCLRLDPDRIEYLHLRLQAGNIQQAMRRLEKVWETLDPDKEFLAEFLDEEVRGYYTYFSDILYMVGSASLLAIIIACMGLFGMAAFSAEKRTKEIGIRKAMGASSGSIAYLVSRSYLKLILVAILIGLPLAWLGNNAWLQNIAYRVDFGPLTLLFGAFIITFLSFATILGQTLKSARRNPVNSLRYE